LHRFLNGLAALRLVRQLCGDKVQSTGSVPRKFFEELFPTSNVTIHNRHTRALCEQRPYDRLANTRNTTGHEGGFVL
jgi:hypothetical protein